MPSRVAHLARANPFPRCNATDINERNPPMHSEVTTFCSKYHVSCESVFQLALVGIVFLIKLLPWHFVTQQAQKIREHCYLIASSRVGMKEALTVQAQRPAMLLRFQLLLTAVNCSNSNNAFLK